jgi:hypothetical protein
MSDNNIKDLSDLAYVSLDNGDTQTAGKILERAIALFEEDSNPVPLKKSTLACMLIDVGTELGSESLISRGRDLFADNYQELSNYIEPASIEYNLGNAKKSLYRLQASTSDFKFRPNSIVLLTESKNHYWRSLRLTANRRQGPQQHVNLANSLDSCARVVEALRWYESALEIDADFGMAHLNRGLALLSLNHLSGTYSINLLDRARQSFSRAIGDSSLPTTLREQAALQRDFLSRQLLNLGWDEARIAGYDEGHEAEFEEHDHYWRFCLDNYLALSEHALYCRCAGARRDDLSVISSAAPISGDFVPRLELLLNRLKSEFCLARALYYQAMTDSESCWDTHAFEGTFTELHESEAVGLRPEFLRTSFRLCFGILDRIAQGLNELYEFAESTEVLYFESFWRPMKERKGESGGRWESLNLQENMGLVALYSLATDLNRKGGEWGHFKEIRNALEHGVFALIADNATGLSPMVQPQRISSSQESVGSFASKALHMLQFVASAIFSFAFVVRIEGRRDLAESDPGQPCLRMEAGKKPIGKE